MRLLSFYSNYSLDVLPSYLINYRFTFCDYSFPTVFLNNYSRVLMVVRSYVLLASITFESHSTTGSTSIFRFFYMVLIMGVAPPHLPVAVLYLFIWPCVTFPALVRFFIWSVVVWMFFEVMSWPAFVSVVCCLVFCFLGQVAWILQLFLMLLSLYLAFMMWYLSFPFAGPCCLKGSNLLPRLWVSFFIP